MSYLVLARKWRPQTFEDVVGQQAVVQTLRNALRRERVAHAMLFSGVRGVGKTTLARLMAKVLNCREGEPDVPCNHCESCLEIMAGSAVDLHEIDGASNRGIQEIRELKENIRFFPSKGRFKVIIIDEVHMLTTEAFNALLKTLEEPPAHVYFMFATTESHKIPITILSRCQRYELKRVPFAELVTFFAKIAAAEGVRVSARALEMIAREAEGSVRDGLSLLDQLFSFGGDQISDEDVSQVLGLVDRQVFENLARALLAGDLAGSLEIFSRSIGAGMDLKRFATDLLAFFRALLIVRLGSASGEILDLSDQELTALGEIAAERSYETLAQAFNLLFRGVEEIHQSSRPRLAMEMCFVRLTQAGQLFPAAALLARLEQVLSGLPFSPPADKPSTPKPLTITSEKESDFRVGHDLRAGPEEQKPASVDSVSSQSSRSVPEVAGPEVPIMMPVAEEKSPELPPPVPLAASASDQVTSKTPAEPFFGREVKRHWDEFLEYVRGRKPWMAQILCLCTKVKVEGDDLLLKYEDSSVCKVLQEREHHKLLNEFAQDFFQHGFRVVLSIRGAGTGKNAEELDSPLNERRALANDPLVQMAADIFSGQVGRIRTGPTSR